MQLRPVRSNLHWKETS